MQTKFKKLFQHFIFFIVVEIILVWIAFREFPFLELFSVVGIGHLMFYISLLLCAWIRIHCKKLSLKMLASLCPLLLHMMMHIVALIMEYDHHISHHQCDHHGMYYSMIAIVILSVFLIVIVEYVIHKKEL